ncbi:MAG: hypothetical protein CM15mV133_050 [uncultured marine virus]|nr:MAG: hypothetical protein CM15mV133_050 [uncultured marine virus]
MPKKGKEFKVMAFQVSEGKFKEQKIILEDGADASIDLGEFQAQIQAQARR